MKIPLLQINLAFKMQEDIGKTSIFMSLLLHIYLNTILDIVFLLNKYLLFYSTSCQIEQFS